MPGISGILDTQEVIQRTRTYAEDRIVRRAVGAVPEPSENEDFVHPVREAGFEFSDPLPELPRHTRIRSHGTSSLQKTDRADRAEHKLLCSYEVSWIRASRVARLEANKHHMPPG